MCNNDSRGIECTLSRLVAWPALKFLVSGGCLSIIGQTAAHIINFFTNGYLFPSGRVRAFLKTTHELAKLMPGLQEGSQVWAISQAKMKINKHGFSRLTGPDCCPVAGICILLLSFIGFPGAMLSEEENENLERSARLVQRGRELRKIGDLQGALHDLNEAVRLDSYSIDAYVQRGITRSRLKDFDGSYFDFEKALEIDPGDITALYGRGVMHQMQNDIAGALRDFNTVISLNPKHNLAIYRRGNLKFGMDLYKEAIKDFSEIIERKPNSYSTISVRGICKMFIGDFSGALDDFDRALAINPRLYRTFFVRGKVHLMQDKSNAALYDFDKALQINRQYPDPYLARGLVSLILGRHEEALRDLEKTLTLFREPEFEDAPQLLLWFTRMHLGKDEEANQRLQKHHEKRLALEEEGGAELPQWYSTQVRFQFGEIDESYILAQADGESEETEDDNRNKCKMFFYAAMNKLLQKDAETAIPLLQKCIQTNQFNEIEYLGARLQLRKLGVKLENTGQLAQPPLSLAIND